MATGGLRCNHGYGKAETLPCLLGVGYIVDMALKRHFINITMVTGVGYVIITPESETVPFLATKRYGCYHGNSKEGGKG